MWGVALAAVLVAQAPAWRSLGTVDGVTVETRPVREEAGRQITRVRATTTAALSCAAVRTVLVDVARFDRWIELSQWRQVPCPQGVACGLWMYGRHDMPFPFSPRDYVVRYLIDDRSDDGVTVQAQSVPGGPAPDGAVRLQVASTWTARRVGDQCQVVYEYDGDLGGSFPPFLLEGAWKTEGPKLLAALLRRARAAPPAVSGG
jgi:hypothetical protein